VKTKLLGLSFFAALGLFMTPMASASNLSTLCSGPGEVYCNGAINGTLDAWTINLSHSVSDSFTVGDVTATKVDFGVWLTPGDSLTGIDWCVSTDVLCVAGGNSTIASGTATVSLGPASECNGVSCDLGNNTVFNGLHFDIQSLEFSLGSGGVALSAGTYYLTLQNAVVSNPADFAYWDENDGPSTAANNSGTPTPSEAFAIDGTSSDVPEPGSLVLFGTGTLLLCGAIGRKLRQA
jgi:hypothetical protein